MRITSDSRAYPSIYADPKYRCLCDTHVEKGAHIIAIVGTVLSAMGAVAALIASQWYTTGMELVWTLLYASILYAQKKREPVLYLPYLVLAALVLLIMVLVSIFFAVAMIIGPKLVVNFIGRLGAKALAMRDNVDRAFREAAQGAADLEYGADVPMDDITINTYLRIVIGVLLFILILVLLIKTFFYAIIFRAWRYMRDEQKVRRNEVPTSPRIVSSPPLGLHYSIPSSNTMEHHHHPYPTSMVYPRIGVIEPQLVIVDKPPPEYDQVIGG